MRNALLAAVAAITFSTTAGAATIYISDGNGNLSSFNSVTKASSLIGNTGSAQFDIAFNNSGSLFGSDGSTLFSVNTSTAALTRIGAIGQGTNALTFGNNGLLYGAGGSKLFTINTSTGASTIIGDLGLTSAGDLTFFNNRLYLASTSGLATVNTTTGAATLIGGDGDFFGLGAADGRLYGFRGSSVYTINAANGAATLYSANYAGGTNAFGAAVAPSASTGAVPEPSTWAMMLGGFGLMGYATRRRRVSTTFA